MDRFLTNKIFDKLQTDYGKIKIEKFFQDGMFQKIDYSHQFRLRSNILFKEYDLVKEKQNFIKSLFTEYDVKVTFNFKNNNCIIKFYDDQIMKWRIEFKYKHLIENYNNATNCILCLYDMDKYETRLLNKKLLEA